MKLTLDYNVNATVEVDTETGEVLHVGINGQDFTVNMPDGYFNSEYGDNEFDEYLDAEHPEAAKAVAVASRLVLNNDDCYVEPRWTLDPEEVTA